MKAVQDFNYKVALSSGLKHLQGGKLRQAEEQFRYLVVKFPRADGGHRGLARVYVELGDRPMALGTLRDGAVAIAKGGDHGLAIEVLREAVKLDPLDLTTHRRLAAALALSGDQGAALQEHSRYVQEQLAVGDPARARLEVEYALESLGESDALADLAERAGLPRPLAVARPAPAAMRQPSPQAAPPRAAAEVPVAEPATGRMKLEPATGIDEVLVEPELRDARELEERAAALLASGDRRAGEVAIAAATALRAEGKLYAASDLLLGLISRGIEVHRAERELIPITQAIGRDDLAAERTALLERLSRGG